MYLSILSPRPLTRELVERIADIVDKEVFVHDKELGMVEIVGGERTDICQLEYPYDFVVRVL